MKKCDFRLYFIRFISETVYKIQTYNHSLLRQMAAQKQTHNISKK